MHPGIYRVVNTVTNRTYIGSSVDTRSRMGTHLKKLRQGVHGNKHLQSSWSKHGEKAFAFEHLITCDRLNLVSREQLFIDAYIEHELKLFNKKPSFESRLGFRYLPTAETIAKIALANTGKKHPPRSHETLIRLSLAAMGRNKGIPRPADVRRKISIAHKGMKYSQQVRDRMSAAHKGPRSYRKGFKHSEETKQRISLAKKGSPGYPRSEETKEKLRRRFKGIPLSADHVAKLKAAWVIRRQREVRDETRNAV